MDSLSPLPSSPIANRKRPVDALSSVLRDHQRMHTLSTSTSSFVVAMHDNNVVPPDSSTDQSIISMKSADEEDSPSRLPGGLSLLLAASLLRQEQGVLEQRFNSITTTPENHRLVVGPAFNRARRCTLDDFAIPSEKDVMCGRGGLVNKNQGNVIFRHVVHANKVIYRTAPKRHRAFVSESIVQAIQQAGGRFLEQRYYSPSSHVPHNNNSMLKSSKDEIVWIEIPYRKAVQKTSQALRERTKFNFEESSVANTNHPLMNGSSIKSSLVSTHAYARTDSGDDDDESDDLNDIGESDAEEGQY